MSDDHSEGWVGFTPEGETHAHFWGIRRLWALSASLPIKRVPLTAFEDVLNEMQPWFGSEGLTSPTLRELAEQAKRIYAADLSYPIIRMAGGQLFDGKHRLAKAFLLGDEDIAVVQFTENPEPDFTR